MTILDSPSSAQSEGPTPPRRPVLTAVIVFALLAVIHTWPLITDPAHLSRNDSADAELNEWIVSWVARQLPRDPAQLFSANIFAPETRTLAFSEPLIPPGAMAIPIRWAGASPVLTYNILLLVGLVLMGVATSIVMTGWTGDLYAGLLAGSAVAFNSQTMTRLAHIQAIHAEWMPLVLWSLDRLVFKTRTRDALWLSLFVILLSLTSGYLAIFTAFILAAATLMRAPDWWGRRATAFLPRLVLATLVTMAIVLPVMWPDRLARSEQGLHRSLAEVTAHSASPISYLVSGSLVHYDTWSHYFRQWHGRGHTALFPGVTVLLLSIIAIGFKRDALTRRRVWMIVGIAAVSFVLSLGTNTPVYTWIYDALPPMEGLRAVGRFGGVVLFALGLLAGLGLAAMRVMLADRRRWLLVASVGCLFLVNLEALHTPVWFDEFDGIPRLYRAIGKDPDPGAAVEIPFYPHRDVFRNAPYELVSTEDWRPLLNGYSGFTPEPYTQLVAHHAWVPFERVRRRPPRPARPLHRRAPR